MLRQQFPKRLHVALGYIHMPLGLPCQNFWVYVYTIGLWVWTFKSCSSQVKPICSAAFGGDCLPSTQVSFKDHERFTVQAVQAAQGKRYGCETACRNKKLLRPCTLPRFGGHSAEVQPSLRGVRKIFASARAFAALTAGGEARKDCRGCLGRLTRLPGAAHPESPST